VNDGTTSAAATAKVEANESVRGRGGVLNAGQVVECATCDEAGLSAEEVGRGDTGDIPARWACSGVGSSWRLRKWQSHRLVVLVRATNAAPSSFAATTSRPVRRTYPSHGPHLRFKCPVVVADSTPALPAGRQRSCCGARPLLCERVAVLLKRTAGEHYSGSGSTIGAASLGRCGLTAPARSIALRTAPARSSSLPLILASPRVPAPATASPSAAAASRRRLPAPRQDRGGRPVKMEPAEMSKVGQPVTP
jgi:hypothetical protein